MQGKCRQSTQRQRKQRSFLPLQALDLTAKPAAEATQQRSMSNLAASNKVGAGCSVLAWV
jgi:hypothetical protein